MKLNREYVVRIERMCQNMRLSLLDMALSSGQRGAHISGSLSCIEIYAVLYGLVLKYDVNNPAWEGRDRIGACAVGRISRYGRMWFFPEE